MKEMRSRNLRSVFGSLFFICATVFFCLTIGNAEKVIYLSSLWTLLLIIPALVWMICARGPNVVNSIIFYMGFGFFIYECKWVEQDYIIELAITMSLMAIGLTIIGSIGRIPPEFAIFNKKRKHMDQETIKHNTVFIANNTANYSKNIKGGTIKAALCTCAYDASEGIIKNNSEILLNANFGRIVFVVPKNCKIILNSSAIFGHIINRTKINADAVNCISIKAKTNFGEIIIKN